MNLKQIVVMTDKKETIEELMALYPECFPNRAELEKVYDFIKETPAMDFKDFEIRIALVDPSTEEDFEDEIDEEAYLVITGYSPEATLDFTLSFTKWEEWANADIIINPEIHLTNETLVAVCLYEMTFYGYDQETIAREFSAIESGISKEMFH